MIASKYRIEQIGNGLKNNTNQYVIVGTCIDNSRRWYIVDDNNNQCTWHVDTASRPSWDRYIGVNPFQPGIDLWLAGFVPSYDGTKWRLYSGKTATVVWEGVK